MADKTVAGELYYDLDGQLLEIKRQLRQPSGYPFDPVALKRHLQDAVEGKFEAPIFSRDMSKEGWTLLEDTREPWPISIANMELVSFLKEGESCVGGEELMRRSREELRTNLGQRHAEFLSENQNEIPEEFRKYILVFTGTIWRDRHGYRRVAFLYWLGGPWVLGFSGLECDFGGCCRLLRSREPACR